MDIDDACTFLETKLLKFEFVRINATEPLGVANNKWIFLEQLLHEGLKFGIDYQVLLEKKKSFKAEVEGLMIKDGMNDSWSDDRKREYIIKKQKGKLFISMKTNFLVKAS